jgi:hypothetical protein
MRNSLRKLGGLGLVVTSALACAMVAEKDAAACGGCFHPPTETGSVITDHRMILSVSPQQTTLYDQIRYQGSPSSFAWVLPIAGEAKVGLSADTLFTALDSVSTTTIVSPNPVCPGPPNNCPQPTNAGGAADASAAFDSGVVVSHNAVVGPYETVQLHSTDPTALNTWLTTNGYAVPADVQPIIAAYVNEHFDFLAMKLVPGAGVQSMRPVRVTTAGASPVLPLRMVAAGTGATVGITLWIVADGRYETQSFPSFRITDEELVWDWASNQSNYRALRAQKTAAAAGRVFEMESSLVVYKQPLEYAVERGSTPYPYADAGAEYPPVPGVDGGAGQTSDQARIADMATLFTGIQGDQFRLTRLRADLSHASLAADLVLQASADQSVLSNVRHPVGTSGSPQCPQYQGCDVVGYGPPPKDGVTPGTTGDGSGSAKESFSCATATPSIGDTWPITLAGIFGLLGFGALRQKRRRA